MYRLMTVGVALLSFVFLFTMSASADTVDAFVYAPADSGVSYTTRTDDFSQAGYGFYANASGTATINALGYLDLANGKSGSAGDGLQVAHTVALLHYNAANYKVIAEATISAGTATTLSGGYRWVSIPEVTLTDTRSGGDYYLLVASHGTDIWTDGGVATVSGQSFGTLTGTGRWSYNAIPSVGGTANFGSPSPSPYGGANMAYVTIPEPSAIVLCVSALVGLLAYAWRRRR